VSATARLLTTGQVAQRLGLHIRKVQRMAEAGDLPYVDKLPGHNGRYVFDADVIEHFARVAERFANKIQQQREAS
jgi:excisionase family DNA binding protein